MRLLGSCLFCCVVSIGSARAVGQQRMFYVPAGTDPTTTTPGEDFVVEVTPGTSIVVEVFADDVTTATQGYSVISLCRSASADGGADVTYIADSVTVDSGREDWIFAGAGAAFPVADTGNCDAAIACTITPNCPTNTVCGDDGFCTIALPRSGGVLLAGNVTATEPKYLGTLEIDIPVDASGEYTFGLACLPGDTNDDCPVDGTSLNNGQALTADGLLLRAPVPLAEIVHGTGQDGETQPFSGFIDARRESSNGVDLNDGLTSCKIRFNQAVFGGPNQEPVTPANFVLSQTDGGTPPTSTSVTMIGGDPTYYEVAWNRPLSLQQWTTIRAFVSNAAGDLIRSVGDLGPGVDEPDRIDFGFLPCDVNQNSQCSPIDVFIFRGYVTGVTTPPKGSVADFADTDRNGIVNPLDLFRFRQVVNGVSPATQAWAFETIPAAQP